MKATVGVRRDARTELRHSAGDGRAAARMRVQAPRVDCTESPDEEHVPIVGKLLDGCAEHGVEIVGEDD